MCSCHPRAVHANIRFSDPSLLPFLSDVSQGMGAAHNLRTMLHSDEYKAKYAAWKERFAATLASDDDEAILGMCPCVDVRACVRSLP